MTLTVHTRTPAGRYSEIVRLGPPPDFSAGQHLRLRKETDGTGKIFSAASAPGESRRNGAVELYVAGEEREGRIDFWFGPDAEGMRFDLLGTGGDFTLERIGSGYEHLVMIATGTGIAPFRSMIRDLTDSAGQANRAVTLLHSHHTPEEMVYHGEFSSLRSRSDFCYVPSVTRTKGRTGEMSTGRVTALLRLFLGMTAGSGAVLSPELDYASIARRFQRPRTLIMACGNPEMLADVKDVAAQKNMTCVVEG